MFSLLAHFAALRQAAGHLSWALWPRLCLGCDAVPAAADALGLCPACRAGLWPNRGLRCRACDRPRLAGDACGCALAALLEERRFAGCRAPWRYTGSLASCIVRGKFAGARFVFSALGQALANDPATRRAVARCDALVPVPSTRQRVRERGFNAATLLAEALAAAVGPQRRPGADLAAKPVPVPVRECLERLDVAPPRSLRPATATGRKPPRLRLRCPVPQRVLVVDDVLTTGTTLAAAMRTLWAGGGGRVAAVVVACRP